MAAQRESFLEEIAEKIPFEYREHPPQVYIIGSIGAGKSSLIHGIHTQLRYTNRGLKINQRRKVKTKEEVWELRKKHKIHRRTGTFYPESSLIYTHSSPGIIPLEIQVEGSHPSAEKLFSRETTPQVAVVCLDLTFIAYLLNQEADTTTDVFIKSGYLFQRHRFKNEETHKIYISLLEALDQAAYWKEQDVPVLALGTHYLECKRVASGHTDREWKIISGHTDDPETKKQYLDSYTDNHQTVIEAITNHKLLHLIQQTIQERKTGKERKEYSTSVPTQAPPLPQLFSELFLVDSRYRSRYGVEEAAYRIARAALPQFDDLRLVSLSHQVPDTERVIKYISLR